MADSIDDYLLAIIAPTTELLELIAPQEHNPTGDLPKSEPSSPFNDTTPSELRDILDNVPNKILSLRCSEHLPDRKVVADRFTRAAREFLAGPTSPSSKHSLQRLPQDDYRTLFLQYFKKNPRPSQETKKLLAKMSSKSLVQVNKWFQNYRCRSRKAILGGRSLDLELSVSVTTQKKKSNAWEYASLDQNLDTFEETDIEEDGVLSFSEIDDMDWNEGPNYHSGGDPGQSNVLRNNSNQAPDLHLTGNKLMEMPAGFPTTDKPLPFHNFSKASLSFDQLLKVGQDDVLINRTCAIYSKHLHLPQYPIFPRLSEAATRAIFIQSRGCWKRKACHDGGGNPTRTHSMDGFSVSFDELSLRPKKNLPRRKHGNVRRIPTPSSDVTLDSPFYSSSSASCASSREHSPSRLHPNKRPRKLESFPVPKRAPSSMTSTPALSRSSSSSSCESDVLLEPSELGTIRARLKAVNNKLAQQLVRTEIHPS